MLRVAVAGVTDTFGSWIEVLLPIYKRLLESASRIHLAAGANFTQPLLEKFALQIILKMVSRNTQVAIKPWIIFNGYLSGSKHITLLVTDKKILI